MSYCLPFYAFSSDLVLGPRPSRVEGREEDSGGEGEG